MGDLDAAIAVAVVLVTEAEKDLPRSKRGKWLKIWFLECSEFGHTELLLELRHNESQDLQNFLRMDFKFFIELLRMLDPMMVNPTTSMWGPISLTERLSITLRYLATENTFEDIKITSAVAPQT